MLRIYSVHPSLPQITCNLSVKAQTLGRDKHVKRDLLVQASKREAIVVVNTSLCGEAVLSVRADTEISKPDYSSGLRLHLSDWLRVRGGALGF